MSCQSCQCLQKGPFYQFVLKVPIISRKKNLCQFHKLLFIQLLFFSCSIILFREPLVISISQQPHNVGFEQPYVSTSMQDYEHHKMWKITKSQFHIPYDTNLKCDMCVNFGILHKLLIKFLSLTNHHIAYITLYNITIGVIHLEEF